MGGLALKWRWRERMRKQGKPTDRPNLVMGINVQVCWEKFCRYWDVEARQVPMEGDRFHLGAEEAVALCDENTIGAIQVNEAIKLLTGIGEPLLGKLMIYDALEMEYRKLGVRKDPDCASVVRTRR